MGSGDRGRKAPVHALAAAAVVAVAASLAHSLAFPASAGEHRRVRVVDEAAVTAMDLGAGVSNTSPVLAADPGEPRFVVMANRIDAPDFGCALQVSGDAGRTWLPARPVGNLPEGVDKCYAPEVAFDSKGRLYYLYVGLHGAGNEPVGAFLVTSSDRARTFSPPRRVLGPLNFAVRMAIDRQAGERGRLHLVWLHATSDPPLGGFGPPPNPILAAHSDDGGLTFSEPVQVSDRGRQRVVAPALALGAGGAVHVGYYDLGRDAIDYQGLEGAVWEEPWSLVLATSDDGGRRFGPGRVVDGGIVPFERVMLVFTMAPPALVADADGLVCAAWADARRGDADVFTRCSGDGARRWRPARRVNDDRVGSGARQYLPRLALSPGGRLDAVFLDRRHDPRNVFNHVFISFSTDGGRSFAANRRISKDRSDSRIGARYAHPAAREQYEMGSRLGLLSRDDDAVAAWPDTRHSRRSRTSQDLFSATVALPEGTGGGSRARLTGPAVALVVAGLASLAVVAATRRRRRAGSTGAPEETE